MLKEIMHFHYITYGHALGQEPLPWGSSNLQFWWTLPWSSLLYLQCSCNNVALPYLTFWYFIIVLCLGVENILKEIMHFHYRYMTFMTTPLHIPHAPRLLTMLHITNGNPMHKWWAIGQKIIIKYQLQLDTHTCNPLIIVTFVLHFDIHFQKYIWLNSVIHAKPVSHKLHKKETICCHAVTGHILLVYD